MARKKIPEERLTELKHRLDLLPLRNSDRFQVIKEFAEIYGVSLATVYRRLRERKGPLLLRRSDSGAPRNISLACMEQYCRLIAAMKKRTLNKKGHHLPTSEATRLLEEYGIETPEGLVKAPKGLLKRSTVDRYLKTWGLNLQNLSIQPVATRFQAKYSNECWHFDLSPSDLKDMPEWPEWISKERGRPVLMLYSAVDDRSGVVYQEYHAVFGEDVEAALRFLFNAMSFKDVEGFPLQGRPGMIYMDNGPIAKSKLFKRVMDYLEVEVRCHMPGGKSGRRKTARAKGKVERPFRTVKELHETLYHFHTPTNLEEANTWLRNYLYRYNEREHRLESHSRNEDWLKNLPAEGILEMCEWDRFCTFSREPESRKVGIDARIPVGGIQYQVDHELVGKDVILWWGIFDDAIYVEDGLKKYGPYEPVNAPIPLNHFRSYKKTEAEKQADMVEELARVIQLPKEAMTGEPKILDALGRKLPENTPIIAFNDPDPFHELKFPDIVTAKLAISDYLGKPLAKLDRGQLEKINAILVETLNKSEVFEKIEQDFTMPREETQNAK